MQPICFISGVCVRGRGGVKMVGGGHCGVGHEGSSNQDNQGVSYDLARGIHQSLLLTGHNPSIFFLVSPQLTRTLPNCGYFHDLFTITCIAYSLLMSIAQYANNLRITKPA